MIIHEHIETIKTKDMDRKEFLGYVGAGLLSLAGAASIVKALDRNGAPTTGVGAQTGYGFGSGAYGGDRRLGKLRRGLE